MKTHMKESIKTQIKLIISSLYSLEIRYLYKIHIMNSLDTIDTILEAKKSVARFGDGELGIILYNNPIGFQSSDALLRKKMLEILQSNDNEVLICLPSFFISYNGSTCNAKHFWKLWNYYNLPRLFPIFQGSNRKIFGDSHITRPWMDWQNINRADLIFNKLKQLWNHRDIIIVEGKETRLGVGNDLFSNTNSISRILCPATNAFDKYDIILSSIDDFCKGQLILIALGPTATCLAYDLSKKGYWAIDVGHIDVEYEWFLKRSTIRLAIKGKYVNEVNGGNQVIKCNDEDYLNSIVLDIS